MDGYIGEIRIFSFPFAPEGWLECDGSSFFVDDPELNDLFKVIRFTYGGDGKTVFSIPDMRGRVPLGTGSPPDHPSHRYELGEIGGSAEVTLLPTDMPTHLHALMATTSSAQAASPANNVPAKVVLNSSLSPTAPKIYASPAGAPGATLSGLTILPAGQSRPHTNLQPSLPIKFFICFSLDTFWDAGQKQAPSTESELPGGIK
jgi:microcystin-dependent protein